jgi:spermidine synthase
VTAEAVVVERVHSSRGELVLRKRGDIFQIVSNGVFLMDTADGRSEQLLAQLAIAEPATPTPTPTPMPTPMQTKNVLIAGLGVGFTLAEVLRHKDIETVTVVEIEDAIVRWNRGPLAPVNDNAVDNPRVRIVVADFAAWIKETDEHFDAICLDVDNGPEWTVTDHNRRLYAAEAVQLMRSRLTDGGRLTVWSSAPAPRFERRLEALFGDVRRHVSPAATGPPDIVWVARRSG